MSCWCSKVLANPAPIPLEKGHNLLLLSYLTCQISNEEKKGLLEKVVVAEKENLSWLEEQDEDDLRKVVEEVDEYSRKKEMMEDLRKKMDDDE